MHIYNLIITDLQKFVKTPNQKGNILNIFFNVVTGPKKFILLRPGIQAYTDGETIKSEADKLSKQLMCGHFPVTWLGQIEKYTTDQIRLMLLNHKHVKSFQDKIIIFGTNKLINLKNGDRLINETVYGYPDCGWVLQIFEL